MTATQAIRFHAQAKSPPALQPCLSVAHECKSSVLRTLNHNRTWSQPNSPSRHTTSPPLRSGVRRRVRHAPPARLTPPRHGRAPPLIIPANEFAKTRSRPSARPRSKRERQSRRARGAPGNKSAVQGGMGWPFTVLAGHYSTVPKLVTN